MLTFCVLQIIWYASLVLLNTESTKACQTASNIEATSGSTSSATSIATYYHCYEVATAIVRCAKTGSSIACPSPTFRKWGTQIFSDVNSCTQALGYGPYFLARTGLVYANRRLAQEACEKYEGAKLAVVHSIAEFEQLLKAGAALYSATHNGHYTSIWLGLDYDAESDNWYWYDDKSMLNLPTGASENDCIPGSDIDCNCAYSDYEAIFFAGPTYCNSPDGYTAYAMCYGQKKATPPVSQNSGKYFVAGNLANGLASPTAASAACAAAGGALATVKTNTQLIESVSTIGFLSMEGAKSFPNAVQYWINLQYRDSAWKWGDNMTLAGDITNWSASATPNSPGSNTCVYMEELTSAWYIMTCDAGSDAYKFAALCMKS